MQKKNKNMKKIIIMVLLPLLGKVFAQNIDASLFAVNKIWDNSNTMLSWTTYTKKTFSLQMRTGFDAPNTVAIIPGKIFKIKETLIVPELGVLIGEHNSISPEYYIITSVKNLKFYLFGQYRISLSGENNYTYFYNQALYKFNRINAGIGAQYYQEVSGENKFSFIDAGPQVKILLGKDKDYYIKPWYTFDPLNNWRQKLIIGAGITI